MAYDRQTFRDAYLMALINNKDIGLWTRDDEYPYCISPRAIKSLEFKDDGISFFATFEGGVRQICVYKDDVIALMEMDDE